MKKCFKCEVVKPLAEFHKHPQMADGHLNKCKECTRKDVKENRAKNIEYYRAYDVLRAKEPERVVAATEQTSKWRAADKKRTRAHNMVARAVRAGKLVPLPCKCGRTEHVHAHHDSYDKPLDVQWFCPPCHRARHAELEKLGITP